MIFDIIKKITKSREREREMESSGCVGMMAVVAISSSVALFSLQIHKRLASDFMKKAEMELGGVKIDRRKKKVRFAADVIEPSADNKEYRRRRSGLALDGIPLSPSTL